MKIDKELKNLIPPLAEDELKQLETNLVNEGWRNNERIITWNNIIVDGHNRYSICKKNNINFKTEERKFKDKNEVILWMIDNQLGRRNLVSYDRIRLVEKSIDILTIQTAEKNIKAGLTLSSSDERVNITKEVAKHAKVGDKTVSKVRFIVKKANEETKNKLSKGEETINSVYTTLKRAEKENKREKERIEDAEKAEHIQSPEELFKEVKFSTIVIDPPWDWGDEGDVNQMGRAKPDYSTISFEDLKKLPIDNLTKKDAHIYLWITNRSLPKGFELLESWGFRYIVCLTWCKPSFGMGNYFRGSTEQILFGVKGSLPLKRKDVGTWFMAPRGKGGHSSKPEEFYKLVESCSPGLYLDYFGRDKRDGWYIHGINNTK